MAPITSWSDLHVHAMLCHNQEWLRWLCTVFYLLSLCLGTFTTPGFQTLFMIVSSGSLCMYVAWTNIVIVWTQVKCSAQNPIRDGVLWALEMKWEIGPPSQPRHQTMEVWHEKDHLPQINLKHTWHFNCELNETAWWKWGSFVRWGMEMRPASLPLP